MNVRWDAVVQCRKVDSSATPSDALHATCELAGSRRVDVRLFGALALFDRDEAITLEINSRTTVVELLEILCARLGEEFRSRVFDSAGAMNRCCRLFVDGDPVENASTTLYARSLPSQIEIIMLTAAEGG